VLLVLLSHDLQSFGRIGFHGIHLALLLLLLLLLNIIIAAV
jgi:hypothetical protein